MSNPFFPHLKDNLEEIQARIDAACVKSGRKSADVELMAVSKTQPLELVQGVYDLGHRLFGENRVLEGSQRRRDLPVDARIHLIGHLQSNKAKAALEFADSIESIDKLSTAEALAKALLGGKTPYPILLELNTSGEESKDGVRGWDALAFLAESILQIPSLQVMGLMTMAPFTEQEAPIRKSFCELREARERLRTRFPQLLLPTLSMGMSNDFEWAIQEGSTQVRVGTLLFGQREHR